PARTARRPRRRPPMDRRLRCSSALRLPGPASIGSHCMGIAGRRDPRTFDEELLGAETAIITTERTDAERLAEIEAEMEAGFHALADVRCGISLFGSARLPADDPA